MASKKIKKAPLNNGGKTARGKFAPGNKLGKGRPKGALNKVTLAVQNLLDGEAEELTRKAIELAKGGDMAALRLCFDRLLPPRKDRPLVIDVPSIEGAKGLEQASAAILHAVATGEITPNEGQSLSTILEGHRKVIEVAELDRRVSELEGKEQKPT